MDCSMPGLPVHHQLPFAKQNLLLFLFKPFPTGKPSEITSQLY